VTNSLDTLANYVDMSRYRIISAQIWPSSVQVEAVTMVVVVAVVVHIVEVGTQMQLLFHVSFLTVLNP
jgi:hypothetical protein